METTVNKRIMVFSRESKISRKELADSMQISENALNLKLQGIRGMDISIIQNVLSAYPELSAEWLLRGEGEMLKQVQLTSNYVDELQKKYIAQLEKRNAELEQRIELLEKEKASAYSQTAQTA